MSIIHDALKKTQANLNNNDPKKEPAQNMNPEPTSSEHNTPKEMQNIYDKLHKKPENKQTPSGSKAPIKKGKQSYNRQENPVATFFTVIFCLVIIAGAIWFIYQYFALKMDKKGVDIKKAFTIKPKKLNLHITPKPITPKPIALTEKDLPADAIILNGITTMGDKRVALINNEIYQLGESVKGKKIVSISIEKVELEDSTGNITTLKIKAY